MVTQQYIPPDFLAWRSGLSTAKLRWFLVQTFGHRSSSTNDVHDKSPSLSIMAFGSLLAEKHGLWESSDWIYDHRWCPIGFDSNRIYSTFFDSIHSYCILPKHNARSSLFIVRLNWKRAGNYSFYILLAFFDASKVIWNEYMPIDLSLL